MLIVGTSSIKEAKENFINADTRLYIDGSHVHIDPYHWLSLAQNPQCSTSTFPCYIIEGILISCMLTETYKEYGHIDVTHTEKRVEQMMNISVDS